MKVSVTNEQIYIPEWGENQEEKVPIKVTIATPTVQERFTMISEEPTLVDGQVSTKIHIDYAGLVRKHVSKIEGLAVYITDEKSERPITTGIELLAQPGLHNLATEIAHYIYTLAGKTMPNPLSVE